MKSFDEIFAAAKKISTTRIAIAGKTDDELASALAEAKRMKLAESEIFPDAPAAVKAVREGKADVLVKGVVETKLFMQAILDKENGLRTGKLINHITVMECFGRLLFITDGGICMNPTLEEKAEILRNCVPFAKRLGLPTPAKAAVLCAVEKVNPKMPETLDAVELSKMDIPGLVIQGPLAIDNAINEEACKVKGITGPVCGRADILLCPNLLVGNIFAKGLMFFTDYRFGGIAAGTLKPVAFLSRADKAASRLNTIALAAVLADEYAKVDA